MITRKNVQAILTNSAIFLAISAPLVSLPVAQAADQGGYVGFLGGVNIPNGDADSSKSATFGAELGTKIAPQVGIGVFATYYGEDNNSNFLHFNAGTHTHTFNVTGELNFFAGDYFHLGADVGEAFTGASANAGGASVSSSSNNFIYGPEGGFDIPIAPSLTMGGEAHYLLTSADNSNNNLLLLAALKIWF